LYDAVTFFKKFSKKMKRNVNFAKRNVLPKSAMAQKTSFFAKMAFQIWGAEERKKKLYAHSVEARKRGHMSSHTTEWFTKQGFAHIEARSLLLVHGLKTKVILCA
jgi:N-acetylglutamate synthase-like GNAT family acetyltransferase